MMLTLATAILMSAGAQDPPPGPLDAAMALMKEGKWREAIAPTREFIRANPKSAPAWALLGQCHNRLEEFGNARDALEIARGYEPWRTRYAYELGVAYVGLGEWAKGEAQLREAREVFPSDANLSVQLGIALLRQNQPAEARAEFQRAESQNIMLTPLTGLYIIETYQMEGNTEEVRKEVQFYQEVFGPGELADRAGRALMLPGTPSSKRFRIYARAGFEHDDNIAFLGETIPLPATLSHKADLRFVAQASAAYDVFREGEWTVTVSDTIYRSFHLSEGSLDYLRNSFAVSGEWFFEPDWSARLTTAFSKAWLDDDGYSDGLLTEGRVRWIQTDRTWTDVTLEIETQDFSRPNFSTFSDRDATSWGARAAQGFSFPEVRGTIYGGAAYRRDNASGSDYDADSFSLFTQWQSPVIGDLSVQASVEWIWEDYDQANSVTGFARAREDGRLGASVTFRHPIDSGFNVIGYWQGLIVESNIAFFEADKNVVGLGVEWSN